MKKYLSGIFALVMAVAASAFTAPENTRVSAADPHWFSPTGTYMGQRSIAAQTSLCNGSNQLCARGYAQIDQNGQPVQSSFVADVLKP